MEGLAAVGQASAIIDVTHNRSWRGPGGGVALHPWPLYPGGSCGGPCWGALLQRFVRADVVVVVAVGVELGLCRPQRVGAVVGDPGVLGGVLTLELALRLRVAGAAMDEVDPGRCDLPFEVDDRAKQPAR